MICPKCGFSQPDDIYCANCGINVQKYTRKTRKRLYVKVGVLVACFLVLVFAGGLFYHFLGSRESANPPSPLEQTGSPVPSKTLAGAPSSQPSSRGSSPLRKDASPRPTTPLQPKSADVKPSPEGVTTGPSQGREAKTKQPGAPSEAPARTLTAEEWLEKGKALDNDSEEEIQCYLKALELNPRLAPAHFRLGAIYFRQAEYDLADQEFAKFLATASEKERENYDIYVYYSPAEVENLIGGGGRLEAGPEKGLSGTKEGTSRPEGPQESAETSEEAKTVVGYSSVRGHLKVPVLLNDTLSADMLLDTGAGITILSEQSARQLHLKVSRDKTIRLKTLATDLRTPLVKLASIQCGDFRKENFSVAVSELNLGDNDFDGILGMDFLGQYALRIDKAHGRIILRVLTREEGPK